MTDKEKDIKDSERQAPQEEVMSRLHGDKVIWAIFFLLSLISIALIYSASSSLAYMKGSTNFAILMKQIRFVVLGVAALFICYKIPPKWYRAVSMLTLLVAIVLLVLTLAVGVKTNDAQRWLSIGGLQFQPTEFAKIAIVLYLARALEIMKIDTYKSFLLKIIAPVGICIVLILVGSFKAVTFDEMFEAVKALNWEDYIPSDGKFWVTKASSVKSKLFSPSDIQSLVKKAIVDRLSVKYGINGRMAETGASFPIRVFVYKDVFQVTLDTTGDSLHKRGYRPMSGKAPLSETLAASLIGLTPWHKDRILLDPFCGSGTIPIEAAMMAANIAPGVGRHFTAEAWTNLIEPSLWKEIREEARSYENTAIDTNIQGFDIDESVIDIARENAKRAGVDKRQGQTAGEPKPRCRVCTASR